MIFLEKIMKLVHEKNHRLRIGIKDVCMKNKQINLGGKRRFLLKKFFWNIVPLQSSVSFYCTKKSISYTCAPCVLDSLSI